MLSFSLDQTRKFLEALSSKLPGNGSFVFQTFGEGLRKGDKKLARKFIGTLDEVADDLKRLNEEGAGVYVTVNGTDGKGRKIENVQFLRAAFVDDDKNSLEATFKEDLNIDNCYPNIIVRSRGGIHAYWLLDPQEDKLRFTETQYALAKKYDTDDTVKDLSRVMRLPGFYHMKRTGFFFVYANKDGKKTFLDKARSKLEVEQICLKWEDENDGAWEFFIEKGEPYLVTLEHVDTFCNTSGKDADGELRDGDECGYRFDDLLDFLEIEIVDLTPKHKRLSESDGGHAPKYGTMTHDGGQYPPEFRLYLAENYLFRIHPPTKFSGGAHETVGSACRAGHDFDCDEEAFWPILMRWGAMCSPPFVEEDLRYEYDTFLSSTKYSSGTKLYDPEYNRDAQYRNWLRAQGEDVAASLGEVRGDEVPWSDDQPLGVSVQIVDNTDADLSGSAEVAPFSGDVPPDAIPLLTPLDYHEERILTEEKNRSERARERAKVEKKKREKDRAIKAEKGPGYLVWTDHDDPPPLDKTKNGRYKVRPYHPRETAWHFLNTLCKDERGVRTLHYHNDRFVEWDGKSYRRFKSDGYRKKPALFLARCAEETDKVDKDDNPIYAQFKVTKSRKGELLEALQDMVALDDEEVQAPCWLVDGKDLPDPREVICCKNGLLDVRNNKLMPPNPAFFTLNSISIEHDENAGKPVEFLKFLDLTFKDDEESKTLLKWWFGYCLTQDTRHQKMLMLVGESRSGKGVITRLLKELVGQRAYGSMKFHRMASNFALSSALDKTVLVFPDARIGGKLDQAAVVADLLSITGEDPMMIDRKNLDPITVPLKCRVMIVSNEPLKLHDTSGALKNRVLLINFPYGRGESEIDSTLESRIHKELPGILNWAIEGWHELQERGRFFQPKSGLPQIDAFSAQSSPMKQFLDHICDVGDGNEVPVKSLFEVWKIWADIEGYRSGNNATFGKNLLAVIPKLQKKRVGQRGNQKWFYHGIDINPDKLNDFISNNSNFDIDSVRERISPPEQQKLPRLLN